MSHEFSFNKRQNETKYQKWTLKTKRPPVRILSQKEMEYIDKRIKAGKFNQPKEKWLRHLLRKFRVFFNSQVAEFINERAFKVIDTFDLQEEFDGSFLIRGTTPG